MYSNKKKHDLYAEKKSMLLVMPLKLSILYLYFPSCERFPINAWKYIKIQII